MLVSHFHENSPYFFLLLCQINLYGAHILWDFRSCFNSLSCWHKNDGAVFSFFQEILISILSLSWLHKKIIDYQLYYMVFSSIFHELFKAFFSCHVCLKTVLFGVSITSYMVFPSFTSYIEPKALFSFHVRKKRIVWCFINLSRAIFKALLSFHVCT